MLQPPPEPTLERVATICGDAVQRNGRSAPNNPDFSHANFLREFGWTDDAYAAIRVRS
jgi:hypothetical protein